MNLNMHTSIKELLINTPECQEFLYSIPKSGFIYNYINDFNKNASVSSTAILLGLERYIKRASQNPCNYNEMRDLLIKPGCVNVAGFVNFLWQEPFVNELKSKAKELDIELNINIFPKHLKKQFQNYLAMCKNPDDLPEILIGKGFSSFMTSRFVDIFVKPGYFQHLMPNNMSELFKTKGFEDPNNCYHPFGIEELVMVYDKSYLNEVAVPTSWEDILSSQYSGKLNQMGKEQQDHFGFIMMIYLYKSLGENGIRKYAENVKLKQHFTHTIKNFGKNNEHSSPVNIMHQFAAKLIRSDAREKIQLIETIEGNPSVCHFYLLKTHANIQSIELAKHLYSNPIKNIIEKSGTTHITSAKSISGNSTIRWIGWNNLRELPLPYMKEHLSEIAYNHFKL